MRKKIFPKSNRDYHQDFPKEDYEIIVVDNNSTDKTAEIARSLAPEWSRKQNREYFCRQKGIDSATRDRWQYDADTIVFPEWLSTLRQFLPTKCGWGTGLAMLKPETVCWILFPKNFQLFRWFNFLIGKRMSPI